MRTTQFKIFQDPPDGLDETWRHGALLGGMTKGAYDWLAVANAFKLAGDSLIKGVPTSTEGYELVHPALYCYRHAIELYLKTVLTPAPKGHNLKALLKKLTEQVANQFQIELPATLVRLIQEFHKYDERSDAFRYPDSNDPSVNAKYSVELWIDFEVLKSAMDYTQQCFQRLVKHSRANHQN